MKSYFLVIFVSILPLLNICRFSQNQLDDTKLRNIDGMQMVYVPSGTFLMGSTNEQLDKAMEDCRSMYGEKECQRHFYNQERPAHHVSLNSFWIDKTEVTNAQFCKFLNEKGNQSVNGIFWYESGAGSRGIKYGFIDEIQGKFIPKSGFEDYPVIEVSWYDPSWHVRSGYRKALSPSSARVYWIGFRCFIMDC